MSAYVDTVSRPRTTLTEREQRLLLQVTGQRFDGFRDHVIYSLALAAGLREHEILALNVGNLFDGAGRAKRRITLLVFKKSSDNPAPQQVMLSDGVRSKLEKLLAARKRAGEIITASTPVFMSRRGQRLSARQTRHAFGQWQRRAGFERHFTFHELRHTACTNLHRATRDLRLTQRFARHKSIESTIIYTHPTDEELLRGVQQLRC